MQKNIGDVYSNMDLTCDTFPADDQVDPKAYEAASESFQPGDVAVVAEDPEVGVARDDARLEDLLADDGSEGVGSRLAVDVNHPVGAGPGLEEKLPAPTATGLQVDEGPDVIGPDVLRDEAVRGRQHVLLGTVEEEDDVVPERLGGGGQDLQHLQHDGAGHGIVTGS